MLIILSLKLFRQLNNIKKEVITERTKSIQDSVKNNSLSLFSSPKWKAKSKSAQKITVERNDTSLLGRSYIANQQHEGDPGSFSPMRIRQPLFRNIRLVQVSCFDASDQPSPLLYAAKYLMVQLWYTFGPYKLPIPLQIMLIRILCRFCSTSCKTQTGLILLGIDILPTALMV